MFPLSNHKTNFRHHFAFEVPRNKHTMELSTPQCPALQLRCVQNIRELLEVTCLAWMVKGECKNILYTQEKKKTPNKPCMFLLLKINKEILQKVHNCYNRIRFWNRHNLVNSVLSFPKASLALQQCTYLHSQKGSLCMRSYSQQCDKLVCISGNWGDGGEKYCFLQTMIFF